MMIKGTHKIAVAGLSLLFVSHSAYGEGAGALAGIVAPVAAAAAQAATAAIQADADKYIATESARSAITQTQIQADTTLALSQNQMIMNQQNLALTSELFMQREKGDLQRQEMQIAAIEREQAAQRAERKEIRAIEQMRYDQQMALVREQMEGQYKLAKYAINMQALNNALNGGAIGSTTSQLTSTISTAAARPAALLNGGGIVSPVGVTPSTNSAGPRTIARASVATMPASRSLASLSPRNQQRGLGRLAFGSYRSDRQVLPLPASDLNRFVGASQQGFIRYPGEPHRAVSAQRTVARASHVGGHGARRMVE